MNIIEHLDLIDRLVSEQKPPGEIRGHIIAIREQIETYAKESANLDDLKTQNARLVAENSQLKGESNTKKELYDAIEQESKRRAKEKRRNEPYH